MPASETLGRIGTLDVRLARTAREVAAAQRLRHDVFFGARAGGCSGQSDADRFDDVCDHLLVIDTASPGEDADRLVGTCRLLRAEHASKAGGFYSQAEFDIAALAARHPDLKVMEIGRSCIRPAYRSKRTMELLWQGIWAYAGRHGVDVMAGCASFPGTVPASHAESLSLLHHQFRAPEEWRVEPVSPHRHALDMMPAEAVRDRKAFSALPPLIKGYLRLGAMVSEMCVVDADFGTVDVFIILPVARISKRYIDHYGADAGRFAARS